MKKIFMTIFLSVFLITNQAHAVFDVMATVQSGLELYKEVETKVQAIQKKVLDIKKRVVQGFAAATNCFKNPRKCDINAIVSVAGEFAGGIKGAINGVKALEGSGLDGDKDLMGSNSKNLDQNVKEAYTYKKGAGDDLNRLDEQRKKVNGIIADDVATLFAKGVVVRQLIKEEKTEDLYSTSIGNSQSDILAAQNSVTLKSQERLTRILELRAYMISAQSSAELGRNSTMSEE